MAYWFGVANHAFSGTIEPWKESYQPLCSWPKFTTVAGNEYADIFVALSLACPPSGQAVLQLVNPGGQPGCVRA